MLDENLLKQAEENDIEAMVAVAEEYLQSAETAKKAVPIYENVLKLEPQNELALLGLGMFFQNYEENFSKALTFYEKATDLNCPEAFEYGGMCYQQLFFKTLNDSQKELAIEYFKKSIELGSETAKQRLELIENFLSQLEISISEARVSIINNVSNFFGMLKNASALMPNHTDILYYIGVCLYNGVCGATQNEDEAMIYFDKVAELDLEKLASLAIESINYNEPSAFRVIRKVLEKNPNHLDCLYYGGMCLYNGIGGIEQSAETKKIAITTYFSKGMDLGDSRAKEAYFQIMNELEEYVREQAQEKTSGCYIATAVYGSYDCPQVWTLRRYRDFTLDKNIFGRLFIKLYYFISPTLVKWFGNQNWFKKLWKPSLDKLVNKLQQQGVESTPYQDKNY